LTLRIRHPQGSATVSIPNDSTAGALLADVASKTGIPLESLELKSGFPQPKPLSIANLDLPVSSLPLVSGDTLIVSRKPGEVALTSESGSSALPAPVTQSSRPVQKEPPRSDKIEGSHVAVGQLGSLVLRRVPDDNQCLFRAAGKVLMPGDASAPQKLRQGEIFTCPRETLTRCSGGKSNRRRFGEVFRCHPRRATPAVYC
jgi:ubiquitin thioesterase OTU1